MKQGRITIVDSSDDNNDSGGGGGGHTVRQSLVMNKICSQGYPKLKVDFSGWASIRENDEAATKIIGAIEMRNKYMGFLDHQYKPILFTNDDTSNDTCRVRQRSNTVGNRTPSHHDGHAHRKKLEPPLYDEKSDSSDGKSHKTQHNSKWEEITVEVEDGSEEDDDSGEEEEEVIVEEEEGGEGKEEQHVCHHRKFFEEGGFESERVKRDIDVFISTIPSGEEFLRDYDSIVNICSHGPVPGFAAKRLKVLDYKYSFHRLLNTKRESYSMKLLPKDRVSVVKVDTRKIIND